MAGGDEKVVTAAVDQAALEPCYSRALKKRFRLKRKGMLQRRNTLRDLISQVGVVKISP